MLQIAPPSGICEKEAKLEFTEEGEEGKPPELLNLNSVLENTDFPMLVFSRTVSLDGNKEFELDPLDNYTAPESPAKIIIDENLSLVM